MEISAQGINASAGIQRRHLPAQRVFAIDRLLVRGCVLAVRMNRMLCCKKRLAFEVFALLSFDYYELIV